MTTIDAHHHFWRTALQDQPWRTAQHAPLGRDFLPEHLAPELSAAGVDRTILVQSVDEPDENTRLAHYAQDQHVAGVVAWLPVRDPRSALSELDSIATEKLCGVRSLVADDPLDWLTSPTSVAMFREIASRSLAWDIVPITPEQTSRVTALARAVPELIVVIDHLARPPLDSGSWQPWATQISHLASTPNVTMKLSVGMDALTAWKSWDARALERYIEHVCDQFPASRLMLASNWPVVHLRATYRQAWQDLRELAEHCFPRQEDRLDILGRTAQRVYHLRAAHLD